MYISVRHREQGTGLPRMEWWVVVSWVPQLNCFLLGEQKGVLSAEPPLLTFKWKDFVLKLFFTAPYSMTCFCFLRGLSEEAELQHKNVCGCCWFSGERHVNFISKNNHALEACDHDAPSQLWIWVGSTLYSTGKVLLNKSSSDLETDQIASKWDLMKLNVSVHQGISTKC